ncbi:MAG: hypothetical protein GY739_21815 [Mesoflavibacter sp.]|nr:hypothetical protein [Mesoflavibacter sp.]
MNDKPFYQGDIELEQILLNYMKASDALRRYCLKLAGTEYLLTEYLSDEMRKIKIDKGKSKLILVK